MLQNQEKTTISIIKDSAGKLTHSPEEMNKIFQSFHANLHSSEKDPSQEDISSFLNSIDPLTSLLSSINTYGPF